MKPKVTCQMAASASISLRLHVTFSQRAGFLETVQQVLVTHGQCITEKYHLNWITIKEGISTSGIFCKYLYAAFYDKY